MVSQFASAEGDSRRVSNGLNWWCDSHIWHYTTFITLALNSGSWYKQEKAKVPYSVYVLLQALKKIRLEKPQTARNSFSRK